MSASPANQSDQKPQLEAGPDPTTYKRSANAALLGLGTQAILLLVIGGMSLYAESSALSILTYYLFGGLLIWIALWLLHNQHRLERVEDLEAQALAQSDQTAATIFDEAGDQLALAKTRLNNLYKYILPGASVALAIYLLSLGTYQAISLYRLIDANTADGINFDALIQRSFSEKATALAGSLTLLTGALAFASFIISRYIAGMTQSRHWSTLRGGAAYLMGNAMATLLVAVGMVFAYFKSPLFLALVPIGLAVAMALLGIEIIFSFVFGIYRPRKQNETPRIAFDSRLLGWLVRPESLSSIISETINYQFGLEISKTWFYRLASKALAPLVLACLLLLMAMSSVVVIDPAQMGVVTRLGQADAKSLVGPGVHLKLPWPLGGVSKHDVTKVQTLAVGSYENYGDTTVAILWTNAHHGGDDKGISEQFLLTAPAGDATGKVSGSTLAGELAGGRLNVNYRIAGNTEEQTKQNLWRYVNAAKNPAKVLQTIAERELAYYYATHDITHLLAEGRADIGQANAGLAKRIQDAADAANNGQGLGLTIVHVALTSVHPPRDEEVAASFQQNINARYEKDVTIRDAQSQETQILTAVAGSIEDAQAIKKRILDRDRNLQALEDQVKQNQIEAGSSEYEQNLAQIDQEAQQIVVALQDAGGEASTRLRQAQADRWAILTDELIKAQRFQADSQAAAAAPEGFFETRLTYRLLGDLLPGKRLYVNTTDSELPGTIRLDLSTTNTTNLLTGE